MIMYSKISRVHHTNIWEGGVKWAKARHGLASHVHICLYKLHWKSKTLIPTSRFNVEDRISQKKISRGSETRVDIPTGQTSNIKEWISKTTSFKIIKCF